MSQFLSEFLYSALLWGSLITGVLWWLQRRVRIGIVRKLLWLPLFWFGLHTLNAWYGFLLPMSGRLVDADSGQPIPQVRVYANWLSIPMSVWYSSCSGEQAHASDAEGRFAFRFVPYPSLVFGALYRGGGSTRAGTRVLEQVRVLLEAPAWRHGVSTPCPRARHGWRV